MKEIIKGFAQGAALVLIVLLLAAGLSLTPGQTPFWEWAAVPISQQMG